MTIICPHCRTEYDAEASEYGRFVKCAICGQGFVAGTSAVKKLGETSSGANVRKATANIVSERVKNVDWKIQRASVKATTICFSLFLLVIAVVIFASELQKGIGRARAYRGDYSYDGVGSSSLYSLSSHTVGSPTPISANDTIKGALANVKSRYRQKLQNFGLAESYYDETNGICDLMLLDISSWTKFQIVYYRSSGQLEWSRSMPKNVAESLMQDRMFIDAYEKATLGK